MSTCEKPPEDMGNCLDLPEQHGPVNSEIQKENVHKRPELNFTSLVTLALTNDPSGQMGVQDIYKFVSKHFPFFNLKGQNDGDWKSSVRHTLSYSKFFEKKCENPTEKSMGKAIILWGLSSKYGPGIMEKVLKRCQKHEKQIKMSMDDPENFEQLLNGVDCVKENEMNVEIKMEILENPIVEDVGKGNNDVDIPLTFTFANHN